MLVFGESLIYHSVLNIDSARGMVDTTLMSSGLRRFMTWVETAIITVRGTKKTSFTNKQKARGRGRPVK